MGEGGGGGVTAERDRGLLGLREGLISSSGCWFILGKVTEAHADDLGTFMHVYITHELKIARLGMRNRKTRALLTFSTLSAPSRSAQFSVIL